jgi:hypothetical protein
LCELLLDAPAELPLEGWLLDEPAELLLDEGELLLEEGELLLDEGELLLDEGELLLDEGELLLDEGELLLDERELLLDEGELLLDELLLDELLLDELLLPQHGHPVTLEIERLLPLLLAGIPDHRCFWRLFASQPRKSLRRARFHIWRCPNKPSAADSGLQWLAGENLINHLLHAPKFSLRLKRMVVVVATDPAAVLDLRKPARQVFDDGFLCVLGVDVGHVEVTIRYFR